MLARDKGNFQALVDLVENRTRDLRFSGWNVRYSIRRVVSSILALGTKFFVVPGEHGFSSFQVENVHWKLMCAAH